MSRKARLILASLAALVLLIGAGVAALRWHGSSPAFGGPFTLLAADGATVTDQTYRGKILLVYFGYTLCPDVCPTMLNQIAAALAELGPNADKVRPLFITVDPQRDTTRVMADYVKNFGSRIVGLTGTPEQIAAVAKEYQVYYARYETADAPDGYLMDHSAVVYVMNPGGHLVATFTPDISADQMAERLTKLIATTN